jgi:hypothetical protein
MFLGTLYQEGFRVPPQPTAPQEETPEIYLDYAVSSSFQMLFNS